MSNNTIANRNRKIRQDALREQLAEQCRLQHVLETIKKIENADDSHDLARLKAANDQRIKLLGKYLPDLKAIDMQGEVDAGDTLKDFLSAISGKTTGLPKPVDG